MKNKLFILFFYKERKIWHVNLAAIAVGSLGYAGQYSLLHGRVFTGMFFYRIGFRIRVLKEQS